MARIILCGLILLLPFSLAVGQQVTYVYDELGRLVGVIDPNGEAATYEYDAVGNILSISRFVSDDLKIIEFTPDKGPAGTQVTIYGKGFSATPSENTVRFFDGQMATVDPASTTTELLVTVPSLAMTGPIEVEVQSVTDSTTSNFVVAPSTYPTITDLQPPITRAGDSVNIIGSNFETDPDDNVVGVNDTRASISSAMQTNLVMEVPSSGSGKVLVATPAGSVMSSDDLFVAPFPFDPNNVVVTGRMSVGGSTLPVSIETPGKLGLVLFEGIANRNTSVEIVAITNTPSTLATDVDVYDTHGSKITIMLAPFSSPGLIEPIQHKKDGTYEIVVAPPATVTTSLTLKLHDVVHDTGSISVGTPKGISLTVPGQNSFQDFSGAANQKVSIQATNVTVPGCGSNLRLLDAAGVELASTPSCFQPGTGGFLDTVTLPSAGTYAAVADPLGAAVGDMTITVHDVPDNTGTIANGIPEPVSITVPGENAVRTFSSNCGHLISLSMTGNISGCADAYLYDPSWNLIASDICNPWTGIQGIELMETGVFTIVAGPDGAQIGDMTLTLTDQAGQGCGGGPPDPPFHTQGFGVHHRELVWIAMILAGVGL